MAAGRRADGQQNHTKLDKNTTQHHIVARYRSLLASRAVSMRPVLLHSLPPPSNIAHYIPRPGFKSTFLVQVQRWKLVFDCRELITLGTSFKKVAHALSQDRKECKDYGLFRKETCSTLETILKFNLEKGHERHH